MDPTLLLVGLGFALSFIFLSYFKENLILNLIGSISLLIMSGIIIASTLYLSGSANIVVNNSTAQIGNYTIENTGEQAVNSSIAYAVGMMIGIFDVVQFLYFSFVFRRTVTDEAE